MAKKLATTIYITEQQQMSLKELNRRSKVPVAEFIREGIDLVLERYQHLLPGQLELKKIELDNLLPASQSSAKQSEYGPEYGPENTAEI